MSDVLFSVYTPTNDPTWLHEAYRSLIFQTEQNWEWVVVPNGFRADDIVRTLKMFKSPNIRIYPATVTNTVGALKYQAVQHARGKILVELDHDDLLTEDCLSEIKQAMSDGKTGFVYSDWVGFDNDDPNKYEHFSPDYGWESYDFQYKNKQMKAMRGFEPTARSLSEIYYAPNHVRAWTRDAYDKAGGYNPSLQVADDHDLVIRTYLAGAKFHQVQKPLYLYRMHKTNTVKVLNSQIQTQQYANRDKYLHELIIEENRRTGHKVLNIGEPFDDPRIVTYSYDAHNAAQLLPMLQSSHKDNSVGWIRFMDSLQLVPRAEAMALMEEIYRVLVPGGWLSVAVPSTDGRGAFQDLRHASWWNENSWMYWTNRQQSRVYYPNDGFRPSIANYPKFQLVRSSTSYPTPWHEQQKICYTYADMCALKGQRHPGPNGFLEPK